MEKILGPAVIDLALEHLARARVWIDGLPAPAAYVPVDVRAHVLDADPGRLTEIRSAAVELFEPRGGRFGYALLGGQFEPDDSRRLVVETSLTGDGGAPFPGALAHQLDAVRVGLPAEYETGVIAGVRQVQEQMPLRSGRLSFRCAAHSAVGSSHAVFARVTAIVIHIIYTKDLTEDGLRELFGAASSGGRTSSYPAGRR